MKAVLEKLSGLIRSHHQHVGRTPAGVPGFTFLASNSEIINRTN